MIHVPRFFKAYFWPRWYTCSYAPPRGPSQGAAASSHLACKMLSSFWRLDADPGLANRWAVDSSFSHFAHREEWTLHRKPVRPYANACFLACQRFRRWVYGKHHFPLDLSSCLAPVPVYRWQNGGRFAPRPELIGDIGEVCHRWQDYTIPFPIKTLLCPWFSTWLAK